MFLSFSFLVGIAAGGIASLSGALYGAIFLQVILFAVGITAQSLQTAHVYAIYGVVLILVLYFMPNGVAGLVIQAGQRMRHRAGTARRHH